MRSLERLNDQLDLANSAASKLYVPPMLPASGDFLVDSFLDALDLTDPGGVERLPINKLGSRSREPCGCRLVSRNRNRLDHSEPLPRLTSRRVVAGDLIDRMSDLAHTTFGPEPKVDAIDVTFIRGRRKSRRDLPSKLFEVRGGIQLDLFPAFQHFAARRFIHEHQVDVGAEIQLTASKLACRHYRKPGTTHFTGPDFVKWGSNLTTHRRAADVARRGNQHFGQTRERGVRLRYR